MECGWLCRAGLTQPQRKSSAQLPALSELRSQPCPTPTALMNGVYVSDAAPGNAFACCGTGCGKAPMATAQEACSAAAAEPLVCQAASCHSEPSSTVILANGAGGACLSRHCLQRERRDSVCGEAWLLRQGASAPLASRVV